MIAKKGLLKRMGPVLVAAAIGLSACVQPGTQYVPYPSRGTSPQQHETNIAVCERWARGQPGASPQRGLNQGAQGALGGAVVGALLGAILGGGRGAGIGAAVGGTAGAGAGGLYGSQQAQKTYNRAFYDCMSKK